MNAIEEIEVLFRNYFRNNCSMEEYEKVIEIIKDPSHSTGLRNILFEKWSELDRQPVELTEVEKKDIRQTLSTIHHEINLYEKEWKTTSNLKKITGILTKIAAILLLPVMVVSLWYFFVSRNPYKGAQPFITINTPPGSKMKTELPDGTIVWQNAASTIKYPTNFTKRNRQIILTGEAYFEVSEDKLHPFFVKTRDLLIEVTGTKFDVKGYDDEESSSVVLEKGVVSVKSLNSSSSQQYKLIPGDKLESYRTKGEILNHGIDVRKYVSWIDGTLIFRDDPLGEILKKLGRWYNVEIVVNDLNSKFSNLPFNMTIQNESLPQILEYLRHAVPITIKEEKLSLKENGSFNKQKYIISFKKNN